MTEKLMSQKTGARNGRGKKHTTIPSWASLPGLCALLVASATSLTAQSNAARSALSGGGWFFVFADPSKKNVMTKQLMSPGSGAPSGLRNLIGRLALLIRSTTASAHVHGSWLNLIAAGLLGFFAFANIGHSAETVVGNWNAGGLLKVNLSTGDRTSLLPAGTFTTPAGIGLEADGKLIVATSGGKIYRVNAANGSYVLLSDMNNSAQGESGSSLRGVGIESDGKIVVLSLGSDKIIRVDPISGNRTLIATIAGEGPWAVDFDPDGSLIVTTYASKKLYRVHPTTGALTEIASFSGQPFGVVRKSDGDYYVGTSLSAELLVSVTYSGVKTVVSGSSVGTGPEVSGVRPISERRRKTGALCLNHV